jgi:hypothetical protein
MRKAKLLVLAIGLFGTTICSATTIYGYTGQDVTGGRDSQFVITATTVDNNNTTTPPAEDPGPFPSNSFVLTTASVTGDGYATLTLPALAGGGHASWVGPQANQDTGTTGGPINGSACCVGTTTYTVTFSLAGFNLPTTTLELILAADDSVTETLNGHAITTGATTYSSTTTFGPTNETANLVAGTNTLVFLANNSGGGPTGLDAFFELTDGLAAPEPQTFALTALALCGLSALRVRRRKA